MYLYHNPPSYSTQEKDNPANNGHLSNITTTKRLSLNEKNDIPLYGDQELYYDESHLDIYKQNRLRRESYESESSGWSRDDEDKNGGRFRRIFCRYGLLERDRCLVCFHISYEFIKLALRQRSTLFVLLLIIDFIFNTLMLYYEYVYIMVDVDVRHVDGRSFSINNHDSLSSSSKMDSGDARQTSSENTGDVRNINHGASSSNRNRGSNRKEDDPDGHNSISFDQSGQQVNGHSYQYEINLIVYILIYASELNGFYAYLRSRHGWLTLHLTAVCVQLIFLLFLLVVNLHLILVYLFRLMLFFMSLQKSLSISDYQMIKKQRESYEFNSQVPRVQIVTPNGGSESNDAIITCQRTSHKQIMSTWSENSSKFSKTALTVSDQDGEPVGFITLSSELETSCRHSTRCPPTTSRLNSIQQNQRQYKDYAGSLKSPSTSLVGLVAPMERSLKEFHRLQELRETPKVLPIKRSEHKKFY